MKTFINQLSVVIIMFFVLAMPSVAIGGEAKVGVVLLHGNGHPTNHIQGLVCKLKSNKFLVAYPEMPWSIKRRYDVPVDDAVSMINAAFGKLKEKGANKLFIVGHSKGGIFALYYASKYPVDGLVAIAPGDNVAGKKSRNKLRSSVDKARKLIESGQGKKKATFQDFEGNRGVMDIQSPPAAYFSWFDPDGAMNTKQSAQRISADVPILWIVAKDDYKGLRKINIPMFDRFPSNAKTRFYEPSTDHKHAPVDSADEIIKWISEVR